MTAVPYSTFCLLAEFVCEWIETGHNIEPTLRARLHALTRKVRITDRELRAVADRLEYEWSTGDKEGYHKSEAIMRRLLDLRDRYEEIGPYAPAVHEGGQPTEEVQKNGNGAA